MNDGTRMPGQRARILLILLLILGLLASFSGCSSTGAGRRPLVVGVAPAAPPILFEEAGEIQGVEADLAAFVAARLNRSLQFKRYAFAELFPALKRGDVDVVMSGIAITPERAETVRLTEPYMEVGQLAIIRAGDVGRFGARNAIRQRGVRVGYERGAAGELYVANRLPRATAFAFDGAESGIRSLRADRIDFFIHDAPTVWQLASDPSSRDLIGLYRPLTEEQLAWAVRPGNEDLLSRLNTALAHAKREGIIETILARWIPVRVLRR